MPACATRFGSKATSAAARKPATLPPQWRTAPPTARTRTKKRAATGARAAPKRRSGVSVEWNANGRGCSAVRIEKGSSMRGGRDPAARTAKPDRSFTSGGCSRFALYVPAIAYSAAASV
jgi:hypothetical protein